MEKKDFEKVYKELDILNYKIDNLDYRVSTLSVKHRIKKLKSIIKNKIKNPFSFKKKSGNRYLKEIGLCILHPIRTFKLVFLIKKGKLKFGGYSIDSLYLKNGKIKFNREKNPKVSIVIPCYNQIYYTYHCLKSISKFTNDVSYEIIIADDVSYDGTRVLDKYVENINVVHNAVNMGFLGNCNNATKYANGEYILFLNNDTRVTENWLSSLVSLIESDRTIGMVGSKLVFPNGMLQEAGGVIFNNGTGCNYGKFDDSKKPEYNYVRDVDYVSGASLMLSKELWNDIGGFDKLYYPAYCEDSDLAFEVRKRGLRVVYQPKSVVYHYEGVSNGTDVECDTGLKHYQIINNKKLREKWKNELISHPEYSKNKTLICNRDRIADKKVVLVIDHMVPEYDKDAGSKTTFQYLKMLVNKGYIVKFLPDNFYQSEPYTEALQQLGIEVMYGIDYKKSIFKWIIDNQNFIDVVYLNRPHISEKYIDYIKENTNIKVIYYGHDLHFLRENREYEITKNEINLLESDRWKKTELDIMKKSDVVYYPSFVEENLIKSIDSTINVKAINAYILEKPELNEINFDDKNGLMFVGGFNHRPNVDAVVWFANEIYPIIRKKLDIPFYIAGSNPPKSVLELSKIDGVVVKGYLSEEELNSLYQTSKMVVVPLRYGAGIKGKVIETMAKGIPFVTTSTGAEGIKKINDYVPVVDDSEEFAEKVIELYQNNELLKDISYKIRKYVGDNFTVDAAWNIVKDDFVGKKINATEKKDNNLLSDIYTAMEKINKDYNELNELVEKLKQSKD